MKITIGLKSNSIYLFHTTLEVRLEEFKEIKEKEEIPEKYLNYAIEFINNKKISDNENNIITDVIVSYDENGKEYTIYCNKMKKYFK